MSSYDFQMAKILKTNNEKGSNSTRNIHFRALRLYLFY